MVGHRHLNTQPAPLHASGCWFPSSGGSRQTLTTPPPPKKKHVAAFERKAILPFEY